MARDARDHRVRLAAFDWLGEQIRRYGDVLPRALLAGGFEFDGERVPFVGPQGIFKPRLLPRIPLSITTAPSGPYDDRVGSDGLLQYRYRGSDPFHHENVGLRAAMAEQIPLVYFHGIVPGRYLAAFPVFIVGDDPPGLAFTVAIDDLQFSRPSFELLSGVAEEDPTARRRYITTTVMRRLHQRSFRYQVLRAYREQCALCRLRHAELLDAAHIVGDKEEGGEPVVSNGLALCKLHHAAFDRHFLGVRPDYRIRVHERILDEEDGPMLVHGLKGLHEKRIWLPRRAELRPDPRLLARRFDEFLAR